jgi:LysR family cys regulon transcriptional activator
MTLIQLRYLVAIVDAGLNISLAAQHAHSTQPGLSKQLGQIEDELGFKVFIRKGKRLEALTEPGREVIDRAKIILAETASIRALAASRRQEAHGGLRIATTATQERFVLPDVLAALRAQHPAVALHVAAVGEREALEQVGQDLADIAIVSGVEAPRSSHLILPLYRWRLIGLARPEHPLAGLPAVTLSQLATATLMTYDSALAADGSYARAFAQQGLAAAPLAATARDSEIIKSLVRSGAGVGLLAEMAWTPDDRDLARLNVGHLFETHTTWAVLPRDRVLRRPALDFITALAPHLDRGALRAAFDAGREPVWPQAPLWRDLHARSAAAAADRLPPPPTRPALRLVAQA